MTEGSEMTKIKGRTVELLRQVANDIENFLIRIEQAPVPVQDAVFQHLDPTGYFELRLSGLRRAVSNAIEKYDAGVTIAAAETFDPHLRIVDVRERERVLAHDPLGDASPDLRFEVDTPLGGVITFGRYATATQVDAAVRRLHEMRH